MDNKETLEYRQAQPGMSPAKKWLFWGLVVGSILIGVLVLGWFFFASKSVTVTPTQVGPSRVE